jgi:hypothetical protein
VQLERPSSRFVKSVVRVPNARWDGDVRAIAVFSRVLFCR